MPDLLDIVVILECINQLLHLENLIGIGEIRVGIRDHFHFCGNKGIALGFQIIANAAEIGRLSVDLEYVFVCLKIGSTGLQ